MNFLFDDPTQMIHGYRIAYICKEKTAVWTSPSQSTMHGAFGDRDASIPGTQFAVHFHQLYMENITCQLPKDMVHFMQFLVFFDS